MRILTRLYWLAILIAAFAVTAAFVSVNNELARLRFWPFEAALQAKIWVFILIAFAGGMLLGSGVMWLSSLKIKTKLWLCERQIKKLSTELEMMKSKADDKMSSDPDNRQASEGLTDDPPAG